MGLASASTVRWLKEGELLHKAPVYGGAFEVQLLSGAVGAEEVDGKWEPAFITKVVMAQVQEDRAKQILGLLPQAQV